MPERTKARKRKTRVGKQLEKVRTGVAKTERDLGEKAAKKRFRNTRTAEVAAREERRVAKEGRKAKSSKAKSGKKKRAEDKPRNTFQDRADQRRRLGKK